MSMNDHQVKAPEAALNWEFNFAAELPAGVTVSDIQITVPSGLTDEGQTDDLANARSVVRLAGGTHGRLYTVTAIATLSNSEDIVGTLHLRVLAAA